MPDSAQFLFRYGWWRPLLSALGMGPSRASLDIGPDSLRVRFGWAFRAEIPLSSIAGAQLDDRWVGVIGVHGWAGRWIVNGAMSGIVTITIEPPATARASLFPVLLKEVRLSVEDREQLIAALAQRSRHRS